MFNVPDDWNMYYSKCSECGDRTHASEGHACSCDHESEEETAQFLESYGYSAELEDGHPVAIITVYPAVEQDEPVKETRHKLAFTASDRLNYKWVFRELPQSQREQLKDSWRAFFTNPWMTIDEIKRKYVYPNAPKHGSFSASIK